MAGVRFILLQEWEAKLRIISIIIVWIAVFYGIVIGKFGDSVGHIVRKNIT